MRIIWLTVLKEWLLLWRDKASLLILLALPMLLVFLISLSHGNTEKNKHRISLLVMNQDHATASEKLVSAIQSMDSIKAQIANTHSLSVETAKAAIQHGEYQGLVIIPAHFTDRIEGKLRGNHVAIPRIELITDPTLPDAVQSAIKLPLLMMVKNFEISLYQAKLAANRQDHTQLPTTQQLFTSSLAQLDRARIQPNDVQQNVPAWALFGMFFIMIPIAGNMVREREYGVAQRFQLAPCFSVSLLVGKILAFVLFNQIQFWLMLAIGVFILPMFDMPALQLGQQIVPIALTGICAGLAATGFGILVGRYAKTYEQATITGPFINVILSAIGGIFVPTYLMPNFLQKISEYSPLHWADKALIDIFVRNDSLDVIWPFLVKLSVFCVFCIILSLLKEWHWLQHLRIQRQNKKIHLTDAVSAK